MAKTAFAIGAHPDDIEFFMAGTLLLLQQAGYEIHYLTLANGCCGSTLTDRAETARIRREEARQAAALVGAVYHESLCDDVDIFYDRLTLARVASVIRDVAPEILLTHPPVDYMEDHMATCRLVVTAAFCRGMPNFPVQPPRPPVSQKVTLYHCQPFWNRTPLRELVEPDFFVNITDLEERKIEMLSCHASQKRWLDESQGHDSYLQTLRNLDEEVGRMSGLFRCAEGWRRHLHLGYCGEEDDPLQDALRDKVLAAGHR
ncbi:MAG: PIG-L family deacetylase [Pirellulales bacterium]